MPRLPAWPATLLALLVADAAPAERVLVIRHAAIYTLDPARPWAKSLVVRDGRIAYVGDDDAAAYATAGAIVVDARGRMVLPGFHDSHAHPMSGGQRLLRCRLGEADSVPKLRALVRACASSAGTKPWLVGTGWNPKLSGRDGPGLAELDALVPDRPAFLATEEGFAAWVNSKALAAVGIDVTSDLDGLRRDAKTQAPTGVVEGAALAAVRRAIPRPAEAEYRDALKRATAIANRYGITSIVDAAANPAMVDAYRAADAAGELTVRVVAAQVVDVHRDAAQVDEMVARRDRSRGALFRADAAKIFLDGEIDQHSAALLEPYADAPGRGALSLAPETLDAIVRRLDAEGFLIHMHAMGDGAARAGLDAYERAMRANGARDRRHQLAHLALVGRDDVARFGALGVAANFQPFWFRSEDAATAGMVAAIGPERARRLYPIASIAAAHGRIVASSDWPSPSMSPFDAIETAMTRAPQPDQRMPLPAMLAAYTRDAAWIARDDANTGTIEVGKAADLIVVDRDLFEVPVREIHATRVLLTLLDGRAVYRDPSLR